MAPLMTLQINIPREVLVADIAGKLPSDLPSTQNFKMRARFAKVRMINVDMPVAIFVAHEAEGC
jgi:hypothetical protein